MGDWLFPTFFSLLVFTTMMMISIFLTLDHAVQPVHAKTNTVVATIPVGPYPFGVAYNSANKQVYVANTNSDALATSAFKPLRSSVYTIDTYNLIKTIPVGNNTIGIAYDSADNRMYVSNSGSQTVSVIDGTTDTVIGAPIPVQKSPWGIAYDSVNKDIYVANAGSMSVSVISTLTNKVDTTISVKANPHGVAYDPANNEIYVANQGSGTVSVIDATRNTVISDIFPGVLNPEDVVYDLANNDLYVTGSSNFLAIINGSTNSVIKDVAVGSHPFGGAYDSTHKRMYITNSFSNDVSVINATTNTVIGTTTIPVGSRPFGIAFNPSNNATYVSNSLSNTVSVVSTLDRGEMDIAASAENTTAQSGNRQSHYIIASVTDDEDGSQLQVLS